jgi:hypothetical protein
MVLATTMFALVVLGVIAIAALQTSSDALRAGRAFRESALALYAAESGLRYTTGNWPTASLAALNPGDSLDLGWQTMPSGASYRAVINRVDGGGLHHFLMVVQGRGKGAGVLSGQRTVVRSFGEAPIFKWGVFTQAGVTMTGGSVSDSYRSSDGPYNPATALNGGSIATNGSITMNGSSTEINGDATAVGNITGTNITGAITPNATPFPTMNTIQCPSGGFSDPATVPSGSGISYNPSTGNLTVNGGATLTLTGTSYYFNSITLNGNSVLKIQSPGGAHVDITVSGQLDLSGGTTNNVSGAPTGLTYKACSPSTSTGAWKFTGGSGADFAVYAPDRDLQLSGGADMWGALIGKTFTETGGSKIHFDESLQNTNPTQLSVISGSWTELTLY